MGGVVNALAPLPKRAPGTGTVSFHRATNTWRFRTPGRHGQECAGFPTREAAEMVLDNAMRSKPRARRQHHPRYLLRATLEYAAQLAHVCGLDLEEQVALTLGKKPKEKST
jgi:hypothetical protein